MERGLWGFIAGTETASAETASKKCIQTSIGQSIFPNRVKCRQEPTSAHYIDDRSSNCMGKVAETIRIYFHYTNLSTKPKVLCSYDEGRDRHYRLFSVHDVAR